MVQGACNCHAVMFEISTDPTEVVICHCSVCRSYTGNNGVAVVIVKNSNFHWLAGEDLVTHWKKPDADWESSFCGVCGSALPVRNDDCNMAVPAGLLNRGYDALKVAHHIWVDSKASWDEICGSGKQHPKAYQP